MLLVVWQVAGDFLFDAAYEDDYATALRESGVPEGDVGDIHVTNPEESAVLFVRAKAAEVVAAQLREVGGVLEL